MKRRLIKQGKGGITLYLPKKWVDTKGLKPGDEVEVSESESNLLIESEAVEKKDFILNIDKDNRKDFRNILTHLYRRGYDIIHVRGADKEIMRQIREDIENLLLGFEVTKRDRTSCTLENISEPTEDKYPVLLRRVFLITKETLSLILEDSRDSANDSMDEITELRDQTDKFMLFCRRIITKGKYPGDPLIEWEFLTFLMHIQHSLFYMYKYAYENDVKGDEGITSMLESLQDYYDLYYRAFYSRDLKAIYELNRLRDSYQFGECFRMISSTQGAGSVIHSYIREVFRLIQIGSSPILVGIIEEVDEEQDQSM